jgi:hypothetical protein
MRQVTGLVDEFNPRSDNGLGELLRVGRRNDAIGFAPDDQRRRRNSVDTVLKSAVGDRPDELAGTGLCPNELRERVDTLAGIARHLEKASRRFAFGIGEQRAPARLVAVSSIQFLTGRSSRHNPTGSISANLSTDFGAAAANSAATRPPKE